MKVFAPLLLLIFGIVFVLLFYLDVFLPIFVSVAIFSGITLFLISRYNHNLVGLLMLLLWLVYGLPFIHIVPYLWFDFGNENPIILWGLLVNPYMLEKRVIELTAMIGAVGAIGFALGVSLHSKVIVRDSGLNAAGNRKQTKTLSTSIWIVWVILGVALSWLAAPENTLFSSVYTESDSALKDANFSSAWMVSYVILSYTLCDAILDQNYEKKAFKLKVVFVAVAFVVVFLQFMRGDRESIPFVFAAILVYFYWASPFTNKGKLQIPWRKVVAAIFLLVVFSMVVDGVRHSLIDIQNIVQFLRLLTALFESDDFGIFNLLKGTWSAVLLTPLSVAGDYIYKLMPLKFGEDYLNLFLSIPPGFVADAVGYKRPIDSATGPAWEMRYGLGGVHATVLPFMNFRMIGVLTIPGLWAYIFTSYEKGALKNLNVTNLTLLCTIAMAAPHWLWYGEKNGLNALFIWFFLAFIYRLSLSSSIRSVTIPKNDTKN